jgi:heme A synthase
MRKKLRIVLITFAVVLGAWAVLFLLTENESTAPFVYAIF